VKRWEQVDLEDVDGEGCSRMARYALLVGSPGEVGRVRGMADGFVFGESIVAKPQAELERVA